MKPVNRFQLETMASPYEMISLSAYLEHAVSEFDCIGRHSPMQ
ncbi:hypothetical protein PF005_g5472 [Phytophthora fragariae]|uniref:Uncharacterized protein n=1 Tax=Phytophthora fragariae TaxID=53985 RepID=A0A6A3LT56_9STRA|nr:hypothetical protein PF003_g22858 [Phytophthora fragariae]KAE8944299.1 hypothetical protein PF009_g5997 [Phytophthora fragariae]KAE9022456.1 hypothetical protein PF011_g4453 [Phytophthora fragariae]KAE9127371.1 hypothetical protein PF010_g4910 [Phytophthora fragariae]KAE9127619.1 hypothetical protein PF007_g5540 [Phytophthora fragariae]